ncbi:site-specific integrase [Methylotenera sp.]|uniref:tyrosine-type recombinase/integrase n=2 Tax=Methylotenera sp. TaxID=2051956 RepID=UPI002731D8D6|nr:site-specific integrase [Methylotenera sp.]MDP2230317.1 tyrosine-type recombinase/integrase [Methylotenera sp.]MDP3142306.1 tyrosine-type recombinase/integrase [Methylotenera sp.]
MAKTIELITPISVKTLPAGFHSDGGNLYLRVKDTGARSWVFRYKQAGKVTEIGLGALTSRSLKQARELAGKMRTAVKEGKNPVPLVKVKSDAPAKTFKDYALELIESKRAGWRNAKHAQQWENTLEQFTYSKIGAKLPADISLADVKSILLPMWATTTETAVRLRGRIESVLDYAAVHEDADRRNPARWKGNLDKVLPPPRKVTKVIHHPAASYNEVPDIMSRLRNKDTASAYNLRFTILTAARSGESRGALWSEIDTKAKVWTIPAERMKAGREHKVPLCDEAIEILAIMKTWNIKNSDIVFIGGREKHLSDVAINKTLHAINPNVTVHGFRSTFRVWGAETTSTPSAVLELALAHVNQNEVEAAYQRSDLFERRRDLMTTWGNYCKTKGNIVQLVQNA